MKMLDFLIEILYIFEKYDKIQAVIVIEDQGTFLIEKPFHT